MLYSWCNEPLSSALFFIELLFLLLPFYSSPRSTMPRIEAFRDDAGAETVVSSAPADLSSDVWASLLDCTAPVSGVEDVSPWEPASAGDQDTPLA